MRLGRELSTSCYDTYFVDKLRASIQLDLKMKKFWYLARVDMHIISKWYVMVILPKLRLGSFCMAETGMSV